MKKNIAITIIFSSSIALAGGRSREAAKQFIKLRKEIADFANPTDANINALKQFGKEFGSDACTVLGQTQYLDQARNAKGKYLKAYKETCTEAKCGSWCTELPGGSTSIDREQAIQAFEIIRTNALSENPKDQQRSRESIIKFAKPLWTIITSAKADPNEKALAMISVCDPAIETFVNATYSPQLEQKKFYSYYRLLTRKCQLWLALANEKGISEKSENLINGFFKIDAAQLKDDANNNRDQIVTETINDFTNIFKNDNFKNKKIKTGICKSIFLNKELKPIIKKYSEKNPEISKRFANMTKKCKKYTAQKKKAKKS